MSKTIEDIAKEINVSTATVSRALNPSTKDLVRKETRKKVLEVVQKYGYKPNLRARGLASGKLSNLFFLLSHNESSVFYDEYFFKIIKGILNIIGKTDYSLSVLSIEQDQTHEDIFSYILNNETAGLILSSYCSDIEFPIEMLKGYDFPIISLDNEIDIERGFSILLDHENAGVRAAEFLYNKGTKDIILVSDENHSIHSEMRRKGFLRFFEEKNDASFNIEEMPVPFSLSSSKTVVSKIAEKGKFPVSVFVINDEIAAGMISDLFRNGIRCPEDVSILGFDGLSIGSYMVPKLRSVAFPFQEIGRMAGRIFLDFSQEKKIDKIHWLNADITEGGSS